MFGVAAVSLLAGAGGAVATGVAPLALGYGMWRLDDRSRITMILAGLWALPAVFRMPVIDAAHVLAWLLWIAVVRGTGSP